MSVDLPGYGRRTSDIDPLPIRCRSCGKVIDSGEYCKQHDPDYGEYLYEQARDRELEAME